MLLRELNAKRNVKKDRIFKHNLSPQIYCKQSWREGSEEMIFQLMKIHCRQLTNYAVFDPDVVIKLDVRNSLSCLIAENQNWKFYY